MRRGKRILGGGLDSRGGCKRNLSLSQWCKSEETIFRQTLFRLVGGPESVIWYYTIYESVFTLE